MESDIEKLCHLYLPPSLGTAASDYRRAKATYLASFSNGSHERELALNAFTVQEAHFLSPGRRRAEKLFATVQFSPENTTINNLQSLREPMEELTGMLSPCKCVASDANARYLLKLGLGSFVRKAVNYFTSRLSTESEHGDQDETAQQERVVNVVGLILCFNVATLVCTTPENSADILCEDVEFVRATVRCVMDPVVSTAAVMTLWNCLESYDHQVIVLDAEPHISDLLCFLLVPSDNDLDNERNECILGCLACLARNLRCFQPMMDEEIPSAMILWIADRARPMHGYFSCLIVAHLATNWAALQRFPSHTSPTLGMAVSSQVDIDLSQLPESLKLGLQAINTWVTDSVTVEQLRMETKDYYSWHSLKPVLSLLWSIFLEARRLASLSLAFILQGSENRDILYGDVSRDCGVLHCAKWSRDEEVKRCCSLAIEHAMVDGIVPSTLFLMCKFRISEGWSCQQLSSIVSTSAVRRLLIPFCTKLIET